MSVSYKVENISISAVRDRAMFNTFAGNQSYVIKGIGQELEVTYASNSFVVTLGTGEAVICGGSMLSEGVASTLTLGQNESGYIVIEVDLSQTGTNICRFARVSSLVQQEINSGSQYVYDLPLYRYTTGTEGVSNFVDVREIKNKPTILLTDVQNASGTNLNTLLNNKQNDMGFVNLGTITNLNIAMSSYTAGKRYIANFAVGATNAPTTTQSGMLIAVTQSASNQNGEQIAIVNGSIFARSFINGSYGAWTQDMTKENLTNNVNTSNKWSASNIYEANLGSTYPTRAGIYRTTGTLTTGLPTGAGAYGVLVIFRAQYSIHLYVDQNNNTYIARTDSTGAPSTWTQLINNVVSSQEVAFRERSFIRAKRAGNIVTIQCYLVQSDLSVNTNWTESGLGWISTIYRPEYNMTVSAATDRTTSTGSRFTVRNTGQVMFNTASAKFNESGDVAEATITYIVE